MERTLAGRIKSKAIELGFSKVGIAQAERLNENGEHLQQWLNRGYQASMSWMERDVEKRTDPLKILPNAKSILCVALNYYSSVKHTLDISCGKISRYAWGEDYHIIMTERMQELLNFVKVEVPGVAGKIYVDTGLVMDKVWAVRAGIGWMGKHTNVITQDMGSWVFLGEILLDVELECDQTILNHCGTCSACIEACPTQAIVKPYVLDSNKCISYLTIEHRSELQKDIVCKFNNWVYGCDICQDVCPWNRFQRETKETAFKPMPENVAPILTELVEITKEEFTRRFKRSPVKRTKHSGLTRNAKAVLESGNS